MNRFNFLTALVLLLIAHLPVSVFADNSALTRFEVFDIQTHDEIVSSTGVLFTNLAPSSSSPELAPSEERPSEMKKLSKSRWRLTVRLAADDYLPGASLFAVANTASGTNVSTPIRKLTADRYASPVPVECLPFEPPRKEKKISSLDHKSLKMLVKVREKKQEILQNSLLELLSEENIKRILDTEHRLGLSYRTPLNKDIPLEELATRLSAIAVLKSASNN